MVINYFNISRSLLSPMEADSVLIIDSDAELAFPLTPLHWLQAIPRRYPEIFKLFSRIKVIQPLACYLPQLMRKCFSGCFGTPPVEQIFGCAITKGDNHGSMIARISCYFKDNRRALEASLPNYE